MRPPELLRYEILGELGQGGMSVVYKARDKDLGRLVAVKVLLPHLARQPEARHRFHREAQAVAKLRHPNIVEIFDYSGPEAETAFIVTELIEAGTLRDFVEARGGKLSEPELGLLITHTVAKALVHAHAAGVIHRDIKPENVMFTKAGELKLVDFGIAQLDGANRLTATGSLLGSPAHMAPEVIDGGRPDERSDLFSLGTVLYWLATGALPFAAPNPSALFKQILDGRYDDPQMLSARVGNGLRRIIQSLLETDPTVRCRSAASLIVAIEEELAPLELGPETEALHAFLASPDTYALDLSARLVTRLTELGRQAQREGQVGRATDFFNRVLARRPDHPEVQRALAAISRRADLSRGLRQVALVIGVLTIVGAAGYSLLNRPPEPAELVRGPPTVPELRPLGLPTSTQTASVGVATGPRVEVPISKLIRPKPTKTLRRLPVSLPTRSVQDAGLIAAIDGGTTSDGGAGDAASLAGARLQLVIGGSYADVALRHLDQRTEETYTGVVKRTLLLSPGAYELDVQKPGYGRFRTRRLDVSAAGEITESRPDGSRRPLLSPLRLRIPGPDEPRDDYPDWIPETG